MNSKNEKIQLIKGLLSGTVDKDLNNLMGGQVFIDKGDGVFINTSTGKAVGVEKTIALPNGNRNFIIPDNGRD